MSTKTIRSTELLTVPAWTKKMKRRVLDLSVKEVRSLINSGLIPTKKDKKKLVCIEFINDTVGMKMLTVARKRAKSPISKPVTIKARELKTNSPLSNNVLVEGQMVWVGKSFCPAIGMGVTTFNAYIKEGLFKNANIRIEKVGNGTERAKYKIEWMGMKKAMQIKKICYSHKTIEEKRELMEVLLEPDENGLEDEPEIESEIERGTEEAIAVTEDTVNPSTSEPLSMPVLSSKEKIKEALFELLVALAEPIVLRLKTKGVLR